MVTSLKNNESAPSIAKAASLEAMLSDNEVGSAVAASSAASLDVGRARSNTILSNEIVACSGARCAGKASRPPSQFRIFEETGEVAALCEACVPKSLALLASAARSSRVAKVAAVSGTSGTKRRLTIFPTGGDDGLVHNTDCEQCESDSACVRVVEQSGSVDGEHLFCYVCTPKALQSAAQFVRETQRLHVVTVRKKKLKKEMRYLIFFLKNDEDFE